MARRPTINEVRESVGVPSTGIPSRVPEVGGYGRGLAVAAKAFGDIAQDYQREETRQQRVLQEEEDRRALVDAHKLVAQAELDSVTAAQQFETDYADRPFGHGERIAGSFDTYAGKALEKITNPRARMYADQALSGLRTRELVRAGGWELRQSRANAVTDVGAHAQTLASAAFKDEGKYQTSLEQLDAMLELTGLSGDKALRQKHRSDIAYSAALGFAERNPSAALTALDTRGGFEPTERAPDYMGPGERAEWLQASPQDRRALEAAVKAQKGNKGNKGKVGFEGGAFLVEPPDTDVTATGKPGETGVPFIDELTPAQVLQLRNRAEAAYKQDVSMLQAEVRAKVADTAAAANEGEARMTLTLSEAVTAFGPDRGRVIYEEAQREAARGARRGNLQGQTDAALAETGRRPLPDADATPGEYRAEAASRREDAPLANSIRRARQEDWIAQASREKLATIVPIRWGAPEAVVELRNRQALAQSADRFAPGAKRTALTDGEAAAFRQSWHKLDATERARMLQTMRDTLTDPKVYGATIAHIAPDSAATRIAAMRPIAVSAMILRGEDILNPSRAAKSEDGKPAKFAMPSDFNKKFNDAVGDAFPMGGDDHADALQAARAYYAGRAADASDHSGKTDNALVAEAVAKVVGPSTEWSGTGKVLLPYHMDAGEGRNRIERAWDRAMTDYGLAGDPRSLKANARLIPKNQYGEYYVAAGTGFMHDDTGRPVVINIGLPMEGPPRYGPETPSRDTGIRPIR